MNPSCGSTAKFRPYFTAEELNEIILCLKSHPTPRRLHILRYLEAYVLKINHGVVSVAHTTAPSIEQKLGFDPINPPSVQLTGEAAYHKQLINPTTCTPHEIAAAMEWRYRNNLMSEEEERRYENELFGT